MGGGLIQLKFLGDEAEFFVGNPQISFFKSVFKSFSNYSKNLMDVYFEAPLNFNKDTYANIPVHGDLIQDMYLNLNIKVNVSDTFDLTISGTTFSSTKNAIFYEYNSSGTQDLYLYNYIYTLTNTNITNLKITEIGSDIKLFSFIQMIFTTLVSGAVLTYASLHSYNEIVLFGVSLLILATLTGYLMQGNRSSGYQLIMLSSVFGIFSIYYFNLINIELLSTKLLIAQLSINMLIVTSVYFLQSLSNIKVLKTK